MTLLWSDRHRILPVHFIELRGIGIIDVKTLFGVESVKDTQSVDLVIKLEEWDRDKEYDRLGLHEEYTEYLGNKIVCHSLPIRPGRNLAVIVESAAVNHRQKKMGYNAAEECTNVYRQILQRSVKVDKAAGCFNITNNRERWKKDEFILLRN